MLSRLKTWWAAMKDHHERVRHIPEPAILLHIGGREIVLTGRHMFLYEIENFNRPSRKNIYVTDRVTGRKVTISGIRVDYSEKIKFIKATREIL